MTKELSKEACERKINKIKGYVITRELYDNNNQLKPFTYYPRKKCGIPPYFYKTKNQATSSFNKLKNKNKFPANEEGAKVVKFKKEMYLDRY